jgi:hypothetical protein
MDPESLTELGKHETMESLLKSLKAIDTSEIEANTHLSMKKDNSFYYSTDSKKYIPGDINRAKNQLFEWNPGVRVRSSEGGLVEPIGIYVTELLSLDQKGG